MTAGYKSVLTSEPIQWAADFLQSIYETVGESGLDSEYGLALLALEREELRSQYHSLLPSSPPGASVHFFEGRDGACLFVLRQLLAVLPAAEPCPVHHRDTVFQAACRRLQEEYQFLSSFRLTLEKSPPPLPLARLAVDILRANGIQNRLLSAGHPLHLYSLAYEMPAPGYYLYPSHTIICGASDFDRRGQLHCLLHELGHVVYATLRTPQEDANERKKTAEQFAHRFADRFLVTV